MKVWKILFLFKWVIFRFHVSFPRGMSYLEEEKKTYVQSEKLHAFINKVVAQNNWQFFSSCLAVPKGLGKSLMIVYGSFFFL